YFIIAIIYFSFHSSLYYFYSKKQTLPPTQSWPSLYLTPIIFPLLNLARFITGIGLLAPSSHKYIIRISALEGIFVVLITAAYSTFSCNIHCSGFFIESMSSCLTSIITPCPAKENNGLRTKLDNAVGS